MFKANSYLDPITALFERLPPSEFTACGIAKSELIQIPFPLPDNSNFTNPKALLYHYTLKASLAKYETYQCHDPVTIALFTKVLPDGLGDLSMHLYIKHLLQEAFPLASIESLTLLAKRPPFTFTSQSQMYNYPEKACLTPKSKEILSRADLVVQIPTFHSSLGKQTLSFGEYGFINSEHFHPSSGNYSMGLHPLEKGILTIPIQERERNSNHYVAYLDSAWGYEAYLFAILEKEKQESQNLHLHVTALKALLPIIERSHLGLYGIEKVVVLDKPNISQLTQGDSGKTLYIHVEKELSPSEMLELMRTSNPFVGCRGNVSFSEALSSGSLIFYDTRAHNEPFYRDLINFAKQRLYAFPSLQCYFELINARMRPAKEVGKEVGQMLSDVSLLVANDKLQELIYEERSFDKFLVRLLKREIHFLKNPALKRLQKEMEEKLYTGRCSLREYLSI